MIIYSKYRGKVYGKAALKLLCDQAWEKGIDALYDNIAIDNPAVTLFLQNGFEEEYRTDQFIMLKKELILD